LPDSDLSTPREAAQYLKTSVSTVSALARRGDLPYVWIGNGRLRRFRLADLETFIADRGVAATPREQADLMPQERVA